MDRMLPIANSFTFQENRFRASEVPDDEARRIAQQQVFPSRIEKGRFEGVGRNYFSTLSWQTHRSHS